MQIRLERWCGASVATLLMAGFLALIVSPRESEGAIGGNAKASVELPIAGIGSPSARPAANYNSAALDKPIVTTSTTPATTVAPATPVIASLPKVTPAASRPVVRPPVTSPQTTAAPAPTAPSSDEVVAARCLAARQWVAERGLELPNERWEFRCPDLALDSAGRQHWGLACASCENGTYVGINIALIGPSESTLRYVVAHEFCHAIEYASLDI
ncbi:MAG: hypothetical protein ACRDRT_07750 [Pseudonocardiaceae bacterium]